jgi:hypothetical protein
MRIVAKRALHPPSDLLIGMILIGVLESIGSVRSPTVTVWYLEPVAKASITVFVATRSSSATPG